MLSVKSATILSVKEKYWINYMDYRVTVIGAGVVGLAVSRELSDRFDSVLIIDQEESFGRGISSRNSEVVHSGLYYKQNSLKADLCIKG